MTVIERIECPEHGARNVIGRRCGAWERPYVFCTRELVTVEYVPASQLHDAERALREFQAGLTDALRAHNVPAMPSWAEAIHWLARNGAASSPRQGLANTNEETT